MFAPLKKGRVAERLGRGLQNLVQRFKSARDLGRGLTPKVKPAKSLISRLSF